MDAAWIAIMPWVLVASSASILLMLSLYTSSTAAAALVAALGFYTALAASGWQAATLVPWIGWDGFFTVDRWAVAGEVGVLLLALIGVALLSASWNTSLADHNAQQHEGDHHTTHRPLAPLLAMWMFAVAGMLVAVTSQHILMMYLGIELAYLPLYALIVAHRI